MGRELQTRIDIMKPKDHIEIVMKPVACSRNKYRQAPLRRRLKAGDKVQMRNYSRNVKWIYGCIMKEIGSKLH